MSEGIVEQSGHPEEALYNILTAALSKHDEAWQDAHTTAPLSKMPTMYCINLNFFAVCKDVRVAAETNAEETARGMKGAMGVDSSSSKNLYKCGEVSSQAMTPSPPCRLIKLRAG